MTDREELLMVQVAKLQHELANAEYFCNRWRKAARMFYRLQDDSWLVKDQEESDAVVFFRDTYYRENVKEVES
jgi:hypothetical protein